MAFSVRTHFEQSLDKLEKMMGVQSFALRNSPMAAEGHPELDDSPLLSPEDYSKSRSLAGCSN